MKSNNFCIILAGGKGRRLWSCSRGEAYQIAINPDIKASSAAVIGCHLLKQKDVQRIAKHLIEAYANGEWKLSADILRPDVIEI